VVLGGTAAISVVITLLSWCYRGAIVCCDDQVLVLRWTFDSLLPSSTTQSIRLSVAMTTRRSENTERQSSMDDVTYIS
jgi:hypothetical protein